MENRVPFLGPYLDRGSCRRRDCLHEPQPAACTSRHPGRRLLTMRVANQMGQ